MPFLFLFQILNATSELSSATAYQSVRLLSVSLSQAGQELDDLAGADLEWSKPTPGEPAPAVQGLSAQGQPVVRNLVLTYLL